MVWMLDDHHVVRQLDDLLSLLLLLTCGKNKQGIIHSLQQFLLIIPPQLVVVRPVDDLFVYPLQRTPTVDLVLNCGCGVLECCAEAQSPLVDQLLYCRCLFSLVQLGDARQYR